MPYSYLICLCCLVFSTAQAYQRCFPAIGLDKVCYDTYNTVGFCCDYHNGYYRDCCHYTEVWALWYFWLCLVVFFAMVAAAVAAYTRYRKNKNRNRSVQVHPATVVTHPMPQSSAEDHFPTKFSDAPPSYEQLHVQGVEAQRTAYSSYSASEQGATASETTAQ